MLAPIACALLCASCCWREAETDLPIFGVKAGDEAAARAWRQRWPTRIARFPLGHRRGELEDHCADGALERADPLRQTLGAHGADKRARRDHGGQAVRDGDKFREAEGGAPIKRTGVVRARMIRAVRGGGDTNFS